jgi:hypothetical protein
MDAETKPRMSKEAVQQIIDSRLAAIMEKELGEEVSSSRDRERKGAEKESKRFRLFKK